MALNENNKKFQLENLYGVKGKIALITGGGTGIGLMATQALGMLLRASLSLRIIF